MNKSADIVLLLKASGLRGRAGFLQSEGFRVRIEFIALACVGCIGRIARGQF